ncbi:GYD domain-containing protein [Chloroflexota bacterium]
MSVCILLTKLTDEGRKTALKDPERLNKFKKDIEATGVKLQAQYILVGQYDILEIFEGENREAICKAALETGMRGVSQIISLMGMTVDELTTATKSE